MKCLLILASVVVASVGQGHEGAGAGLYLIHHSSFLLADIRSRLAKSILLFCLCEKNNANLKNQLVGGGFSIRGRDFGPQAQAAPSPGGWNYDPCRCQCVFPAVTYSCPSASGLCGNCQR